MLVKKVYVNDVLIGQASTWAEVYRLLGVEGVHFMGKPGAAEGPTAFYLSGAIAQPRSETTTGPAVSVTSSNCCSASRRSRWTGMRRPLFFFAAQS